MGIGNFHKWLNDNFQDCITNSKKRLIYDYIYIDGNHLLHNAVYNVDTEEDFFKRLKHLLNHVLNNNICRKGIFLALDGPSPYAKIILQRQRRLKGIRNLDISKFTSLNFTPGTVYMNRIYDFLFRYVKNFKKNFRYLNIDFRISNKNSPDEGELKLFRQLLVNYNKYSGASHLVIGNDADIIVMAMSLKPIYNIHVVSHQKGGNKVISIEEIIKKFNNQILKHVMDSRVIFNDNINELKDSNIRDDFVILSLLMGNDYLPKLNFVTFDTLWRSYYKTKRENLKLGFVNDLCFSHEFWFRLISNILVNILPQFRKLDISKYQPLLIENYLEGILWCFNMYRTTECSMYDYVYKFKKGPSPMQIFYYLIFNEKISIKLPISDTKPLPNEICPMLLIPKKARHLIPQKYQKLIDNEYKNLYFEEDCKTCAQFSRQLSKYHIELKNMGGVDDNTLEVRKNISRISIDFDAHRRTHDKDRFCVETIIKLNQRFNFT